MGRWPDSYGERLELHPAQEQGRPPVASPFLLLLGGQPDRTYPLALWLDVVASWKSPTSRHLCYSSPDLMPKKGQKPEKLCVEGGRATGRKGPGHPRGSWEASNSPIQNHAMGFIWTRNKLLLYLRHSWFFVNKGCFHLIYYKFSSTEKRLVWRGHG